MPKPSRTHVKQAIVVLLFLPAIIGALVPSYLHLADWYEAWMPEGYEHLSSLAALVTEGAIVACGLGVAFMPPRHRDRWKVYALQGLAVFVSVYVNSRWAWEQATRDVKIDWHAGWYDVVLTAGPTALDVILGSAFLPLFAVFGEAVMEVIVRSVGEGDVKTTSTIPATDPVASLIGAVNPTSPDMSPAPTTVNPTPPGDAPEPSTSVNPTPVVVSPAGLTMAQRWLDAVKQHGVDSPSRIAALEGVSRQTASAWKAAARTAEPA